MPDGDTGLHNAGQNDVRRVCPEPHVRRRVIGLGEDGAGPAIGRYSTAVSPDACGMRHAVAELSRTQNSHISRLINNPNNHPATETLESIQVR